MISGRCLIRCVSVVIEPGRKENHQCEDDHACGPYALAVKRHSNSLSTGFEFGSDQIRFYSSVGCGNRCSNDNCGLGSSSCSDSRSRTLLLAKGRNAFCTSRKLKRINRSVSNTAGIRPLRRKRCTVASLICKTSASWRAVRYSPRLSFE